MRSTKVDKIKSRTVVVVISLVISFALTFFFVSWVFLLDKKANSLQNLYENYYEMIKNAQNSPSDLILKATVAEPTQDKSGKWRINYVVHTKNGDIEGHTPFAYKKEIIVLYDVGSTLKVAVSYSSNQQSENSITNSIPLTFIARSYKDDKIYSDLKDSRKIATTFICAYSMFLIILLFGYVIKFSSYRSPEKRKNKISQKPQL